MRLSRLAVALAPLATVAVLAAAPSVRKDPHGVYAMVDSVIFEPAAGTPDRVRLWGAFAIANPFTIENGKLTYIEFGRFDPPVRGYMYYAVNPRDQAGSRSQWAAISAVAGSGRLAAWGAHIPPWDPANPPAADDVKHLELTKSYNGRVRSPDTPLAEPDTFPQRMNGASAESLTRMRAPATLGFVRPDTVR